MPFHKRKLPLWLSLAFVGLAGLSPVLQAQVPQVISYEGRVAVDGVNFDSAAAGHPGVFKFAVVNADGTETYWSNDGSSTAGSEPTAGVSLAVTKGLYSVLLGDTAAPLSMSAISGAVFTHPDVRLRVWFDDGTHGSQKLSPDRRIASVAYAVMAGDVADGSISSAKIAAGAVGSAQLAAGAVQTGSLAAGAVDNTKLANAGMTLNAGAGLAGGGAVSLGGALTLSNAGVLSVAGGGGITVSAANGNVTIGSSATALNTPGALVVRDANGDFAAGTMTGNLLGHAASATTAVTAASALTALTAASATDFSGLLAGEVSGPQGATVVGMVGGVSAANVAAGANLANTAASGNVAGTIVLRNASGDISVGTVTALGFAGNGAGLTGVPGTLPWQTVIGTAQAAAANTGYLADNAALVTVTLPAVASAGDIVRVTGVGAGGWALVPAAGQSVTGYAAGLGPAGAPGAGAAVQYIGGGQWQAMAETQLGLGAVQTANIAAGAVGSAQLAAGAVQTGSLAAGAVDNTKLANAGMTLNAGAGLAGGGAVSLGGALTLSNAGVLSVAGGGGITVSAANGNVTIGSSATALNTPGALVVRDANGDFAAGTMTGNLLGHAASATTAVTAASALTALTAASATDFSGLLAGEVSGPQGATVVGMVGGVSAANVAAGANLANTAASGNVAGTIVLRNASGDISVGTVTALGFAGNGAGLTGVPGTLPWQTVIGTAQAAAANTGYLADNAALVTVTLPAVASAGDIVRVTGVGAGGWALVPAAGQSVTGYAAGLGPAGAPGAGAAVQYIGGGQWQAMAETQLGLGAVQTANIAAGAVGGAQLAAGAVQAGSIAAGAVDNTKLANAAVTVNTGAGLAGGGVVNLGGALTLSIPDGALTTAKLADGSISTAKIANGAVGSQHLAPNAVQTASIAAGAVDNTKLAHPAVTVNTGTGLAGGGVLSLGGALTLTIPNGAVTAEKLAPGAAAANYAADGQSFGLINNIAVNQWLGTAGTPTFAGQTILNTGTGSNKPAMVFDRGIVPKGRVSFQRTKEEPGWSGLVLSVNADWNDQTGYDYDDGGRSQSIMQLEYEWLTPQGFRQNEFNWTSGGRRIWAHYCRTDDITKAGVAFIAPMNVTVPAFDTTDAPALLIQGFRGVGEAVQIVLQNNNETTAASSVQLVLRGAGSGGGGVGFSSEWYLGTDRYWTGTNNFYILDGKGAGVQERLFIDPAGKVGIGTVNPASKLDVAGAVNATGYTVNGVPLQTPKFSLTYNAAQVHAMGNSVGSGYSWEVAESVVNAVSPFGGGAAFVKQAKTDNSRGCIALPRTWTNGIQVKVRCWYSLKVTATATATPNNAVVLYQGLSARSAAPTSISQGFAPGWDLGSAESGPTTFQLAGGTAGEILVDERVYTIPANCDLDGRLILFGRYGQQAQDTEPQDLYFLGVTIDQL